MELDFTTIFAGAMGVLLLAALWARTRQSSVTVTRASRSRAPAKAIRFVDTGNTSWLEVACDLNLAFRVGSGPTDAGAKTGRCGQLPVSAEREDVLRRLEGSKALAELFGGLFEVDERAVRGVFLRPGTLTVLLRHTPVGAALRQKDVPKLPQALLALVPKLVTELKNLEGHQTQRRAAF